MSERFVIVKLTLTKFSKFVKLSK